MTNLCKPSLVLCVKALPRRLALHRWLVPLLLGVAALHLAACTEERAPSPPPAGSGGSLSGTGGQGGQGGDFGLGGESASPTGGSMGIGGEGSAPDTCEGITCQDRASCDDSGGAALCVCEDGFQGPGCDDINECQEVGVCGSNALCANTFGDYYCDCASGYVSEAGVCVPLDECAQLPCDANAQCTTLSSGYSCECKSGYYGNGWTCGIVDYCAAEDCDSNGTCINTPGGAVCQCDSGFAGQASCAQDCSLPVFASLGLEDAVRAQISKPTGVITQSDLAGHTQLNASGYDVDTLSGLECWPHLEVLDLFGTSLDDTSNADAIDALDSLNQLKELYLGCTSLKSIDVLAFHPALEKLSIAACPDLTSVSDYSALDSLQRLVWLDISGLSGGAMTAAGNLRALEYLSANNMGLMSLPAMSGLLEAITLAGNGLSDLSALSRQAHLYDLDVSRNALTSLDSLPALSQLTWLNAIDNQIAQVPNLMGYPHLKNFYLNDNSISSLAGLEVLGAAGTVGLGGNEISTLAPLVGTNFRGTLNVVDNSIDCGSEATNLDALEFQGVRLLSDCP